MGELDKFQLPHHGSPLVAEEDQGVVYFLREGGRQPVMLMPRSTYDQLVSWNLNASEGKPSGQTTSGLGELPDLG